MTEKKCYTCQNFKTLDSFNKNKARKDGLNSICKECSKSKSREYYSENKENHLKIIRKKTQEIIKRNQEFVLEYLKTHPCVDCEETDLVVLDFDHLKDKKDSISNMIRLGKSIDNISKEISKCEVRCANCHRRKTARDRNYYRYSFEAS